MTIHTERRIEQPSTGVPFAITDSSKVPAERYFSPEFAQLEKEKLWPHVWQMACRLDEIPRPGDFTEYKINDQSIMVVRQADNTVKAYFNACRHRATALATDTGTFHGGQIVCPYHGWRWNLDGSNSYVFAERGFAPHCVERDSLRLRECQVGELFGMVWINMDPEAPPLSEAMGEIAEAMGPIGFERMQVRWWRHLILPGNWKVAQEAFLEAYHVMQAHPSLAMGAADDDFNLDAFGGTFECFKGGHAHMLPLSGEVPVEGMTVADYFIQFNNALYFGTDAYATDREMFIQQGLMERDIDPEQFPLAFFGALYEYAQGAGIPLPPPPTNTSGYGHIFPNITVLPAYGNSIMYRVRPNGDDPESCIFEVWALQIPAAGEESEDRPELEGPIPVEDWPQIFQEDFANITAQQKGLKTKGLDDLVLSERYEAMIINSHRTIDRYLAR
ncbi:(2Fe-2S)-binding protein [Nocardia nova]|uniref:(2Fe-2S)-binding protein n=1 Tax=Nocardia nova TaxID=37330 RepID=A0A2S6APT4_9NOCA|nr:aromatic ring-hydroxylating dioxygenase subunit alpha [Nocardia nova]PPJ27863.1 (2Fe-2S)-binding protein [Nocardia nova]PPJ37186.1 (2Fe-2S)-binding protein [Nocardia nova]